MSKFRGNRVITGGWGKLFYNGRLAMEVSEVNADIDIERGDIFVGIDKDSKMNGLAGSGTMTAHHVTTFGKEVLDQLQKGLDPRFTLSIVCDDPDAIGGQREEYSIGNCWFNKLGIAGFTRGEDNKREYDFGFTVTDSDFSDYIV